MTAPTQDRYDLVPYDSHPFPQTHPDRAATIARLMGMTPAQPGRSRVLELGCAAGGNLIPMALEMPTATFVGIDLSSVQVEEGQRTIATLGLDNIRLVRQDIAEAEDNLDEFDYIIAHGVYSWVPQAVQESILSLCERRLARQGVAYLSYNTLPGWRMRGTIRDLMRQHAMAFKEPRKQIEQARAILDFLAGAVPADSGAYGMLLNSELDILRRKSDYYIFHEHLEENNEPLYFRDFIQVAERFGLQFLAEADFYTMVASNLPPAVAETLNRIAPDLIAREQMLDFLRNNHFRQTLLVPKAVQIERPVNPIHVGNLWVSTALAPVSPRPDLRPDASETFGRDGGGTVQTSRPLTKAAMVVLARHWPTAVAVPELLVEARALLKEQGLVGDPEAESVALNIDVLRGFAAGVFELHSQPSPFVRTPGDRPEASRLARWQALRSPVVTNLRHEMVSLSEGQRRLLPLLDGTRSRDELLKATGRGGALEPRAGTSQESAVEDLLDQLAMHSLLTG